MAKKVMVEIDIFLPQTKDMDNWEFIDTLQVEVDPNHVERDVQDISAQVGAAINIWKDEK